MINQNAILKEQLKKLSNILNKKYTTLRKEVVKTAQVFDNDKLPVFPYEVCFGLFRQFSETASLSSSVSFLPFIQTLINLGFANPQMSRQILTFLLHTKSIPKFQTLENQTKLQQILTILISKKNIQLRNMGFIHSLINLFLCLQNTRYRALWVKTSSAISSITLLLVNEIRDDPTQQKFKEFKEYMIDITKILNGQKLQWLVENTEFYLFLQSLCQILDEKYFQETDINKQMHKQVFVQIIPILRKQLKKKIEISSIYINKNQLQKHWQLTNQNKILILLRTLCKINIIFKSGCQFLQELVKIITDKKVNTIKLYGYEAITTLFRNPPWMYEMLQSNFADLFNFLLTTQFNTIKNIFGEHGKIDLVNFVNGNENTNAKIMSSNQIDLPYYQFNCSHEIRIIIKNLEEVTYSLYSIYGQQYKIDMHSRYEGKIPLQKTYKFCQKTVFETIKSIISKQMTEEILQSLLKISQKFINLSGCFNDPNVSALYIKMMCKYCLPGQFKNIGHRHVQINKMILNTVNCLGHLLTSNCWVIVWKALQNYSLYYNRYLLGKQELQAERQSDVQILYKSMDSIFTQTPKYPDQYLLVIIQSLIQVAYQCLENNYNDETRKIFAFERIQQIYRLNLFRIHVIWPQLSSSLLCITTSKVLYFRLSALSLLNTLIPLSLSYLNNNKDTLKPPLTVDNYEQIILQPWINLVNCQFKQIKQQFIIAVNKIIIDYGHIMVNGWKCILEIVKKTRDLKSLQVIVETFLEKVHNNIMDILEAVDALQRELNDTNQKYLCLTMIWSIGDYAYKNKQNDVLRKIYSILLVPEEMFNLGTEARQSSFYIFAEVIVHNCSEKSEEFWVWIFGEIKIFYTYGLKQTLKASDKHYVEESLKNLLTNLIKIYKKFFLVAKAYQESEKNRNSIEQSKQKQQIIENSQQEHKQWENKQFLLQILGDFYQFSEKILEFRNPQIYQNILKQIKQILSIKIQQSLSIKQFYKFIQSLSRIYYVQNDTKILKCLITYLPAQIYDLLNYCLQGLNQQNFITIYRLMQKVFLLRLQALQAQIKLQQLRIFFQQKYHYQFVRKLNAHIMQVSILTPDNKKPLLFEIYIENFIKTIYKLHLYNDYHSITKSLPLLTTVYVNNIIHFQEKYEMYVDLLKQLVNSRIDQYWLTIANQYKDVPVWYLAIQDLMKICYEYVSRKIKAPAIHIYTILKTILFQAIEDKLQLITQEKLAQYYEKQLEISYFMIENYLLNENFSTKLQEADLIIIIQLICKRSSAFDVNDFTNKGLNAYNLLFKIMTKRDEENQCLYEGQSTILKFFIKRVTKTFGVLQKQGSSINEQEIQELKFVIKKLRAIEISENVVNRTLNFLEKESIVEINPKSQIFRGPYSHLFYFQPYLAKCLKIKNDEFLLVLSEVLWKISEISLKMSY